MIPCGISCEVDGDSIDVLW